MRPTVFMVAGLAFGDEGKGTTVDFLTRRHKAHTVVRYNGGAQAAHNVVTDDGVHHTFQQFGSGTFAGARTFLSKHVLVNPINLLAEARVLSEKGVRDPLKLITVDSRARIITPFHMAANRLRELHRGLSGARHGSCGEGVGETVSDWLDYGDEMISADDLQRDEGHLRTKLLYVRAIKREQLREVDEAFRYACIKDVALDAAIEQELRMLADDHVINLIIERYKLASKLVVGGEEQIDAFMNQGGAVVFEGAQGVLLDEWHGFHPYTTWSTTTFQNADEMLRPFYNVGAKRIGVLRTYLTRHGAGPFVTEDPTLEVPERHNGNGPWQGHWRVGHFDLEALRYASAVIGGVDEIALTHLDQTPANLKVCNRYENVSVFLPLPSPDLTWQAGMTQRLMTKAKPVYGSVNASTLESAIERAAQAPITIRSHGPRACDKSVFGAP